MSVLSRLFWLDSLRATRVTARPPRSKPTSHKSEETPGPSSTIFLIAPGPQITARTQEVCSYSLHIGG